MVRGGALPAVEEWKKTTAEYKQRSIPLGRFDFGQAPSQAAGPSRTSTSSHADPSFSHQRSASQASMRQRTGSFASQQQLPPRSSSSAGHLTESAHDPYFSQQNSTANTTPPAPYDSDDASRFGLIEAASVDSFHQEEGAFWFLMRCNFTSNYSLVLYRSYEDFYEFQMSLMDDMPVEAGREAPPGSQGPPRRIIPRLPGPVEHVDHVTCAQRQVDLTVYLRQLCGLPDYVRSHFRFYEFFLPRSGDVEVSPPSEDFVPQHQAENDIVEYLDRMPGSNGNSPDAEAQQHPQRYSARESQQMRHSASRESYGAAGYGPSDSTPRPGSTSAYQNGRSSRASNNSSVHGASVSSMRSPAGESSGSPWAQQQPPPAFVKIKIFHRNTDDLIAIRVPPGVSRKALLEKTRERLGNDVVKLRYREDIPPEERIGSTSARLVELHSDEDLKAWLQSGKKQVLYVD